MVVQDEDYAPMEIPLSKRAKKFVVVKNHVRELLPENEDSVVVPTDANTVDKSIKRKVLIRKNGSQTQLSTVSGPIDISESDLKELKTVYKNCKTVLQKIESKYGHLLNLKDDESVKGSSDTNSDEPSCDYCSNSQKKKIVFDENGQQIERDCTVNHICIKRKKKSHNDLHKPSVHIEYDVTSELPDNFQELVNILRDTNINKSYRRMVIEKISLLRQQYLSEIRFGKQDIIKQLRENPDDVLEFKGTNLSTLHGYPIKPVEKQHNNMAKL